MFAGRRGPRGGEVGSGRAGLRPPTEHRVLSDESALPQRDDLQSGFQPQDGIKYSAASNLLLTLNENQFQGKEDWLECRELQD